MHEASIIEAVLESAATAARAAGATTITRIHLRVGMLSGVVPEALEFAFEALKPATPAATAALEIERTPATFRCLDCGTAQILDDLTFICPACSGSLIVDSGGDELELTQLEVS
jgi:hydrogenase nickel incorporation protein HypA/HybF